MHDLHLHNARISPFPDRSRPLRASLLTLLIASTRPNMAHVAALQGEIESGLAVLRVLIEQRKLRLSDFENIIGKKSLMSRILSGKGQLTVAHTPALCARFGLSPSLFLIRTRSVVKGDVSGFT